LPDLRDSGAETRLPGVAPPASRLPRDRELAVDQAFAMRGPFRQKIFMTHLTPRRVRLLLMADSTARVRSGTTGTVQHVDDTGTVHVLWEDGAMLGLLPGHDVWDELCALCGHVLLPGCCPTDLTVSEPGDAR
jgi:hypothetical protein